MCKRTSDVQLYQEIAVVELNTSWDKILLYALLHPVLV